MKKRFERGSALLLVLFSILFISGLVVSTVSFLKSGVDDYAALNDQFRTRQLAESGLAFGLEPLVQNRDTKLLNQTFADGGRFEVKITSESTKLNINFILRNNRDDILQTLFRNWGVSTNDSRDAVQGLRDWVNGGAGAPANGPSPSPTPLPNQLNTPNSPVQTAQVNLVRPFVSVQEMTLVPEFAAVVDAQPDWARFITVYGDGTIDINQADADLIALVAGVTRAQAENVVKLRYGPDGTLRGDDNPALQNAEQIRAALGLSQQQYALVQNLLSTKTNVDRIESKGIIGGNFKKISVITNRSSVPVRFQVWQEE